jgi:hypothetical protein
VKPIAVRMIWPEAIRPTDRARAMVDYAAGAVRDALRPRPWPAPAKTGR